MTGQPTQEKFPRRESLREYVKNFKWLGHRLANSGADGNLSLEDISGDKTFPAFAYMVGVIAILKSIHEKREFGRNILIPTDCLTENDNAEQNLANDGYIAQRLSAIFAFANLAKPSRDVYEDEFVIVSPSLGNTHRIWLIFKRSVTDQESLVAYDEVNPPLTLSEALRKTEHWATDTSEFSEYRRDVARFLALHAK